ncbi:MAG: ATP-binding protein [Rhodococcus sp. (in: high G+C Gram-positive bacteria)]|uniref:sensor histidine kinase n=1 Tax=Rhodococcus sp. TaxID=1831 RepID=UPI003BB625CB
MASYSPPRASSLNPADTDPQDRIAGLRILRQFAVFVASGYLAYAVLTLPAVAASLEVMDPWWTLLALPLTFGTGIALGPVAWRGPARRIRVAAAVATVGYLITVGSWWFGWNGNTLGGGVNIWFSLFCGLAAIAAAIAFRPMYAFVVLCVVVASTVTINHTVRAAEFNGPLLPDMAWAFAFSLVYFAAAVMAMKTAAVLDSTRAEAYAATADAAAVQARTFERQRFAQLTHDGVMATLLTASRQGASAQLAQQARGTLADLDTLGETAAAPPEKAVSAEEAVARIRAASTAIEPGLSLQTDLDTVSPGEVIFPSEVVRTIGAAAAEAVRNSRRHAGPTAAVSVKVTARPDRLCVEIVDNGVGFDPRTVPAERLGIAVSIRGRMSQLPGGTVAIASRRGAGTRVVLEWSAD